MGGEGGLLNGKFSGFHAAGFTFFRLAAPFVPGRRGGIYPSRGCSRRRGVSGPIWNRPLQGFSITKGRGYPVGRHVLPVPQGGRFRPPNLRKFKKHVPTVIF